MTIAKGIACVGLVLAILTFFVPQIPLAIAVICIGVAVLI